MVLAKPKSITPHTKFKAEIYVLAKEEGRAAYAVLQWLPAAVLLPDDRCDGGDDVESGGGDGDAGGQCEVTGELISPIAMDQGLRFAVREGGKTVGSGVVTEILA